MIRSGSRLNSLDSLRGLAAIYVVFFHLYLVPTPNPVIPNFAVSRFMLFGGTGVFLFFIISGFSLTMTMPSHDRARSPTLSYWMRRVFRIAPLFYVMIAVSMIRDQWYFGSHASIASVATNMTFLFNFVPNHQEGIVWASWTIGVEMLFYVLFPVIYRLSTTIQISVAVAVSIGFTFIDGYAPNYLYWSVLGYLPMFIFGILAFKAYNHLQNHPQKTRIGLLITALGMFILTACIAVVGSERNIYLRDLIGAGYGALVVGCLLAKPPFLESRLPFFGAISYSLYLVHAPIVYAFSPLFSRITAALPASVSYVACAIVAFSIVIPVAWLTWLSIERPADNFGRRLNKTINRPIESRNDLTVEA